MSTEKKCPQCGAALAADAPEGLCPACLLKAGLASGTRSPSAGAPTEDVDYVPPTPAELAPHFPDLEILELLGRGGMGVVYKARQKQLERLVALKILAPKASREPAFAERFAREARAMARLSHPNIVAVYDFGERGGLYYFIMEFVDGVNLRRLIGTHKIAPREALAIVPQICDALQFAHDSGVVHRDIKPENILLDTKGRVKIADFGLAKLLGVAPQEERLTRSQQAMGTPQYMAPEQLERPLEVDHRADIYSLGVVFYEMLTGELPLGRFAPPSRKVQIDVRLDEIVLRSLEKEPALRYQQASAVKTDVETLVAAPTAAPEGATAPTQGVPAAAGPQQPTPAPAGHDRNLAPGAGTACRWPASDARPRVRLEIAGAGIATVFLADLLFWIGSICLPTAPAEPFTTFAWLGLPFAVLAVVITTVFGWLAVSQIRRSSGELDGLGLAVFDGLLFPLLALDGVIGFLSLLPAGVVGGLRGVHGSLFEDVPALVTWLVLTIGLAAWIDYLIARSVWRAVNKPLTSISPSTPPVVDGPASSKVAPHAANPLPVLQFWQALEDGDYARAWERAAPYFQRDVSKDEWMARMEKIRRPLGKAVRREQFPLHWLNVGTRHETRCKTTFDSERTAMETAVAALQPDGEWRIESYRLDLFDAASATPPKGGTPAGTAAQPPAATEEIRRQVNGPAIGLLVTGIVNWIVIPFIVAVMAWGITGQLTAGPFRPAGGGLPLLMVIPIVTLALCTVMIFAALKMKRLEAYGLAIAASILAIIIIPGNVIGLPVGIWSLVVLSRPEVRAAFADRRRTSRPASSSAGPPGITGQPRSLPLFVECDGRRRLHWPGVLQFCGTIGLVVCGTILAITLALWLVNAPVRLTFQPGELGLVLMFMAACAVMRLAALKLGARQEAGAAPTPVGKVWTWRKVSLAFLAMVMAASIAAGLVFFVKWLRAVSATALADGGSLTHIARVAVWIAIFVAVGLFIIRRVRRAPRGRIAQWFSRRWRAALFRDLPVAIVVALVLRTFVIGNYRAETDAVSPEIPRGSWMLVYKLARTFGPGDIIAYRCEGKTLVGRVVEAGPREGVVRIQRRQATPESIAAADIIGKVVFNTRARASSDRPGGGKVAGSPVSGARIERVVVTAGKVLVEGRGTPDARFVLQVGKSWLSCFLHNDSTFTATIKPAWWGQGLDIVVKDSLGDVPLNASGNKIGPMTEHRGQIVFREGTLTPAPDGSFVIGAFEPETGPPSPISVRVEKRGDLAGPAVIPKTAEPLKPPSADRSPTDGPAPGPAPPSVSSPKITRVTADGRQVLIEGRGAADSRIAFAVGLRKEFWWQGNFLDDSPFTGTLGHGTGGGFNCFVEDSMGNVLLNLVNGKDGNTWSARGRIIFREGALTPGADGAFVVGRFEPEVGPPMPISVRVQKRDDLAGGTVIPKTAEPPKPGSPADILMSKRVTLDFVETPLTDVVEYLKDLTKVQIVIDPNIKDTGAPRKRITLSLKDVTLGVALDLVLGKRLAYEVKDDLVLIRERQPSQPKDMKPTDEELQLAEALKSKKVSIEFAAAPLTDVLAYVRSLTDTQIIINPDITDAKVLQKPITLSLKDVKLSSVLDLLTGEDLLYVIKGNVVVITERPPKPGAPAPAGEKETAAAQDAQREVLRVQLRQAQEALSRAEAPFKAGALAQPEYQAKKDSVELLKAQIAGDPVEIARVRLVAAQRQFELAEHMFKAGAAGNEEYQAAKNAVELRQAELHAAEAAQTAVPSETEKPTPPPKQPQPQGTKSEDEQSPAAQDAQREVLRVQLRQAQEALDLADAQFKAGRLDGAKLQAAKDNVQLLQAEIAGDPVQVARVRLAAAQRQLEFADARFKAGRMGASEYRAAKNAVELRQAELRVAEAAQTTVLAAKPSPRLQFRLVAGEKGTAPAMERAPTPLSFGPGNWKVAATLAGHKDMVISVAFSSDGKRLFTGSVDGEIKVWDTSTRKELASLAAHRKWHRVLAVSPSGDMLASGGGPIPAEVKLWDARTLQLRTTLPYPRPVYCLAFSRDGGLIAAAGENSVYVWKVRDGEQVANLAAGMWPIMGLVFSPDGRILYVGGCPNVGTEAAANFGMVRAFDAATGTQLGEMTLRHPVEDIDLTKDGRALAVGAGALQVFDLGIERGRVKFSQRFSAFDQEERSGVPVFQEQFGQVAISPNGEVVAAAASSPGPLAPAAGHVALFVLRDGQRIAQLQTPKPANGNTETGRYTITTVAFSPDGTLLAAGGKERVVTLWMAATDRASANGQANSGGSKPPLLGNDAKPAPRLQFRLVAGEKDTAPFEEMPDPGDKTGKRTLRLLKEVLLDESAVAAAAATPGQGAGKQITLALTTAGAERFAQITGNNINRRLAIVFDGKVISAPVIKSRISGIGVITGDFSEEEVARIVKALNRPVAGGQFRAK